MKRRKKIEKKTKPKLLAKLKIKFDHISIMAEILDERDACVAPEDYWCSEVCVSQVLNNCGRFLKRKIHKQSKWWIGRLLYWLDACELSILGYGEQWPSKREKEQKELEEMFEVVARAEKESEVLRKLIQCNQIILGSV